MNTHLRLTQDYVCWNCKRSDGRLVRSRRTGIVYCASCGAAEDGKGGIMNLSLIDTEPIEIPPDGK